MSTPPSFDIDYTARDHHLGDVRHTVLFGYRRDLDAGQREAVERHFATLLERARRDGEPYIHDIVSGVQISCEEAGVDIDFGISMTFRSEGDRNFYVGKPLVTDPAAFDHLHDEFKTLARPFLTTVVVYDFRV